MMKKKGVIGFLPMVLIKLIFAVLLILLITWLLVSLWMALFGNEDKTTKDSFETLFNIIDSKSQKSIDYESTKYTSYTRDNHRIFFFAANEQQISCINGKPVLRPTDCDIKKSCLCLYDDDPDRDEEDKDDEVVMCKEFKQVFSIEKKDFQLVDYNNDCDKNYEGEYVNLIVGVQNSGNKRRVFVWENNDANRKIDEQLKKKMCPEKTGLCVGKKDSEVVYNLQQVAIECSRKDPNKFYWEAKCIFDGTKCDVECVGEQCSTITSCTDFNINKDFYVTNTKEEYFCNNRACNKQCTGNLIEQYTCITGKEQDCKDLINDVKLPDFVSDCSVEVGPYSSLTSGQKNYNAAKMIELGDIIGFDSKKQNTNKYNCRAEIEKYFKKYPVSVCIPGVECNAFVITNPAPPEKIQRLLQNCDINPMRAGGTIAITRQGVTCDELNNYFTNAYNCADTATPRFIE